jgi:hypothetical protein
MRRAWLLLVAASIGFALIGCNDSGTQQAAQDSQKEIEAERKKTGDDKNAY